MNTPQLDGGSFECRQTVYWWKKRFRNPLKFFQVFKDVLMDIEESPLSEEENVLQHDMSSMQEKKLQIKLPVLPSLELPIVVLFIHMF